MSAFFAWPSTLPHPVDEAQFDDYDEPVTVRAIETEMDAGLPKEAYLAPGDETVNVSYLMTDAQRDTLAVFARDTLKGVARFEMQHPRTGAMVEVTFVRDGQKIFSATKVGFDLWRVSLQLRVWP